MSPTRKEERDTWQGHQQLMQTVDKTFRGAWAPDDDAPGAHTPFCFTAPSTPREQQPLETRWHQDSRDVWSASAPGLWLLLGALLQALGRLLLALVQACIHHGTDAQHHFVVLVVPADKRQGYACQLGCQGSGAEAGVQIHRRVWCGCFGEGTAGVARGAPVSH